MDFSMITFLPQRTDSGEGSGARPSMTNTRPGIDADLVPAEIDRWNWGAFLLNWIWGVGNNTFIALLTLVPFVGIVMIFVLGAKGSAWAWRNGRWTASRRRDRPPRTTRVDIGCCWHLAQI